MQVSRCHADFGALEQCVVLALSVTFFVVVSVFAEGVFDVSESFHAVMMAAVIQKDDKIFVCSMVNDGLVDVLVGLDVSVSRLRIWFVSVLMLRSVSATVDGNIKATWFLS